MRNGRSGHRRDRSWSCQGGFTMLELMVTLGILAILLGLGAAPLRNYWLTQGLHGSRDELVSQFRAAQEQAVSESHPLVIGARLLPGTSEWGLVQFNPGVASDPADDVCTEISTRTMSTGVRPLPAPSTSFSTAPETTFCKANLRYRDGSLVPNRNASGVAYVWFYARGTATGGTLTLEHGSLPGKQVSVTVTPITGRVEAG